MMMLPFSDFSDLPRQYPGIVYADDPTHFSNRTYYFINCLNCEQKPCPITGEGLYCYSPLCAGINNLIHSHVIQGDLFDV